MIIQLMWRGHHPTIRWCRCPSPVPLALTSYGAMVKDFQSGKVNGPAPPQVVNSFTNIHSRDRSTINISINNNNRVPAHEGSACQQGAMGLLSLHACEEKANTCCGTVDGDHSSHNSGRVLARFVICEDGNVNTTTIFHSCDLPSWFLAI